MTLPHDPLWPRAGHMFTTELASDTNITVLGVPAHKTSISPTSAHETPTAVRGALLRYSTYSWQHDVDVAQLNYFDAGDVENPDWEEGEARVLSHIEPLRAKQDLLVAIGGDNSITHSVAKAYWGSDIESAGLITFDAHHDIREGINNGSPVRRLIEAGLAGKRVVQIGISDYANSPEYAKRVKDYGITVITRDEMRRRSMVDIMAQALDIAGSGGGPIHLDVDVDVCDRGVVPGCPAGAPGGISADELRQLTHCGARDERVTSIDFTEVDATQDTPDQRTIRLVALCILEAAAGVVIRRGTANK